MQCIESSAGYACLMYRHGLVDSNHFFCLILSVVICLRMPKMCTDMTSHACVKGGTSERANQNNNKFFANF